MEAIILAGGRGSRLRAAITDLPKPMAPISGRPFLECLLDNLQRQGVSKVVLAVGYLWNVIKDYFGERYGKLELSYSIEGVPLGTGGALQQALFQCGGNLVLICNGDSFFNANIAEMMRIHEVTSADVTVALKEMRDFDRYGAVTVENRRIVAFREKQFVRSGFINSGVYIARRDLFLRFPMNKIFSFENDFLAVKVREVKMTGVVFDNQFIDIGIPEDYERAQQCLPDWMRDV